jgi:hypothetical protein
MSDKRDKDTLEQDIQSCVLVPVCTSNVLDFVWYAGIVYNIFC